MNRTHLACYSMIASAFVLAGLLLVSLPERLVTSAEASLVLNKDTLTLMTARTRPDEEALFVLDGLSEKLLIYRLDIAKKQLELVGAADLAEIFKGDLGQNPTKRGR
jgi:hypothetical protein